MFFRHEKQRLSLQYHIPTQQYFPLSYQSLVIKQVLQLVHTYLLIVTTDQNTCLIISTILQFRILQMYHNIVFILHSLPYNAKPKQVLRQGVYVSMHYDLPFKASSLMVFWEKRAIGVSHEIEYLTSMQRGQIIGAAMCLHIHITEL